MLECVSHRKTIKIVSLDYEKLENKFFSSFFPFRFPFCVEDETFTLHCHPNRKAQTCVCIAQWTFFSFLHRNDPKPLDTPKKETKLFYGTMSHKRKITSLKKIEDFSAITEVSSLSSRKKIVSESRHKKNTPLVTRKKKYRVKQ